MGNLSRKIKKHISRFFMFLDQSANYSYAQEGEDRILLRYFGNRPEGFYIDVGAHHPRTYSNTYLFYKKNWRGINIDAMPGSMAPFRKERKRDINIEAAVSDQEMTLDFYIFNEPALNTLDKELAESRHDPAKNHLLQGKKEVRTTTLTKILDEHLPAGQKIDFMSVDIEGHDLQALRSLNFSKYRPGLILVEIYEQDPSQTDIYKFLAEKNYSFMSKAVLTCIFKDNTVA